VIPLPPKLHVLALVAAGLLSFSCNDETGSKPDVADAGADAAPPACPGLCRVSLLAGTPGGVAAADGTGSSAGFNSIYNIVGDGTYLYLADGVNGAVRRVELSTGAVTTVAGTLGTQSASSPDGVGAAAGFQVPKAVALMGTDLYVSEYKPVAPIIRRIALSSGKVTTLQDPGTGKPWRPANSIAIPALAVAGDLLYIAEYNAIWRHDPKTGAFKLLAGDPAESKIQDGQGTGARFLGITGLASGGSDRLFVGDVCTLREVALPGAQVTTVAGDTTTCASHDGKGAAAAFLGITQLAFDGQWLYVADSAWRETFDDGALHRTPYFGQVRKVDPGTWEVSTVAGDLPPALSSLGEADGPALDARLLVPEGVWSDGKTVYLGTLGAVRRLRDGKIDTLAGQLVKTAFAGPDGLALDASGLYTLLQLRAQLVRVDLQSGAHTILKTYNEKTFPLDQCRGMARVGGKIYCAAWNGVYRYDPAKNSVEGLVSYQQFNSPGAHHPFDLTGDGTSLYLSLVAISSTTVKTEIWRIDPTSGKRDRLVESDKLVGSRRLAKFGDALYITSRRALARLDLGSGALSFVAGDLKQSGCKDGAGGAARFTDLAGVAADEAGGRVFFGDEGCHAIAQLDVKSGRVVTLAGSPENRRFVAGIGGAAGINFPSRMLYDRSSDTLYVSDPNDNVILKVTGAGPEGG
jgi:hypothetical protein